MRRAGGRGTPSGKQARYLPLGVGAHGIVKQRFQGHHMFLELRIGLASIEINHWLGGFQPEIVCLHNSDQHRDFAERRPPSGRHCPLFSGRACP